MEVKPRLGAGGHQVKQYHHARALPVPDLNLERLANASSGEKWLLQLSYRRAGSAKEGEASRPSRMELPKDRAGSLPEKRT